MVRNKPRKTQTHGQTDPKIMKDAVQQVIAGHVIREVSKETGISKSTLQRYVAKRKASRTTGKLVTPFHSRPILHQLNKNCLLI